MSNEGNKWKRTTLWVMAITTAVIVVYDIFVAFFNAESGDTISRSVQRLAMDHWSVTFAFGVVFIGHFFLYGRPLLRQPWAFIVMLAIFVGLLVGDVSGVTPAVNPVWFLVAGAIAGRLFWPMTPIE